MTINPLKIMMGLVAIAFWLPLFFLALTIELVYVGFEKLCLILGGLDEA